MKIVAILENSLTDGGGCNQALNAIVQMARLAKDNYQFIVLSTEQENLALLDQLGVPSSWFRLNWLDRLIMRLSNSELGRQLQRTLKLTGPLEKSLLADKCDLVYFPSPSSLPGTLQSLNYIATIWDLCHRDAPEFPEVRAYNEIVFRDQLFRNSLASAVAIIVDSDLLAKKVSSRYGIDSDKFIVMPFSPSPFLEQEHADKLEDVLSSYRIEKGYFFYPAQFWTHKNHVRILEALSILNEQGIASKAVFVGGDKGNFNYVEESIRSLGLDQQVEILGFVPPEHIRALYQGCLAVVMPTYFGPTNLPPLEAWSLGKPLIYSEYCSEQAGDAALLIDPNDAVALAGAMKLVLINHQVVFDLVEKGKIRLKEIDAEREVGETLIESYLTNFSRKRSCWK